MSKLLFVDTETGGLVPEKYDLLSIGAAIYDEETGTVERSHEWWLKGSPDRCHEKALAVNNIDLEKWNEEAVSPIVAITQFQGWVINYLPARIMIAGHNIQFDARFLRHYLNQYTPSFWDEWIDYHQIDTMSIGYALTGKKKLDDLLLHFGIHIEKEKRHTALGDCLATVELYKRMTSL